MIAPSKLVNTGLQILTLVVLGWVPAITVAKSSDGLQQEHQQLVASYGEKLHRPNAPRHGDLLFVVTDPYASTSVETNDDGRDYATRLFELATKAANAGEPSLAFAWATEAVSFDPDHAGARRVLGYEQVEDRWQTAYSLRMAKRGLEWHTQYGWIDPSERTQYEADQRKSGKQWISAEVDAERHQHIDDGWQLRTDHFLVSTNHSLEAGAELATKLEQLYQVWRQLFAGFYYTDREVDLLFAGDRNPRQRSKPFRVIYHKTRDEYNDALIRRQPQIAQTLGIYFDNHREAHFFAGEDQQEGTLYHEAVHQLFQESKKSAKHIGEISNFWAIEGAATYLESLRLHQDSSGNSYFTIGEPDAGRFPAARERVTSGEFYLPLAQLVELGKTDIQHHPQRAALYSQSAGLATFFMHVHGGRYREPFVQYLAKIYAGRDDPGTLASLIGESDSKLDQKYREILESLP